MTKIFHPKIYKQAPPTKSYFKIPTPLNVQLEESPINNISFDGNSIQKWNIDGFFEYNIPIIVHNMTLHATACRIQGNIEPINVDMINQGFVGQLRGWCECYLDNN